MSVNIQLEWTPNPNTLKYVVDQQLIPRGAVNFTDVTKAEEKSPLASRLMKITGVSGVMIGTNFVTVTKGDQGEWDDLNDGVMDALDQHLTSKQPVVVGEDEPAPAQSAGAEGDVEMRIRKILDEEIRPAVANDGGDITLEKFADGVVYLHMVGSCAGCPSSTMTLKMGIENRLRETIPEVVEVISV
jgi:Fe-S cluster biogenesis protein NfuA